MNTLLAHHLELYHYPIVFCFFATGFFVGWELLSRFAMKKQKAN